MSRNYILNSREDPEHIPHAVDIFGLFICRGVMQLKALVSAP